jgi:O-antigen/teichoic acid export membrane protein
LGVIGGLLAWPAAYYYFAHSLRVDPQLRSEMIAAIPWFVIAVPMATVTGVATGALQGLNRFASLNLISVVGAMVFQLAPLAAAIFWSPALTIVLPVSLLAQCFTLALLMIECRRVLLRGRPARYDRSELRTLFRFGFWVSVSAFFTPFVTMVDRLLLGAYVNATAVSLYVVPFNLGQRLSIVGNSAGSALFPRFSSLDAAQARQLGYDSERALSAIMLVATTAAIYLIGPFLSLWVGADFASRSSRVAELIMMGVWLESVSRIPLYALRGQSRPEVIARVDLLQLVPYWIALYVLISNFRVEGVAAAYVFRLVINYALLAGAAGTLPRILPVAALSLSMLAICLVFARTLEPFTRFWFLALLFSLAISSVCAWRILPSRFRLQLAGLMRLRAG